MKKKLFPFLLLMFILCESCTRETDLLSTDFQNDIVGGLPYASIPNNPVGDSILIDTRYRNNERFKIVWNEEQKKELEFSNRRLALPIDEEGHRGSTTWLDFKGIPMDLFETQSFCWKGKMNIEGDYLTISFNGGDAYKTITRMIIRENGEIGIPEAQYDYFCKRTVGKIIFGKMHTIEVEYNARENKYSFCAKGIIAPDGSDYVKIDDLQPFVDILKVRSDAPNNYKVNPQISFNWNNDRFSDEQTYRYSSVNIYEQ